MSGVVPVPKRIRPFADESCSNLLNRLSHLVTNAVRPTHQHLVHNAELSLRGAVKKNWDYLGVFPKCRTPHPPIWEETNYGLFGNLGPQKHFQS